jgi:2-oxoglutarate dehydrogenase complex dehydrogenase (E1) component-like enzyme
MGTRWADLDPLKRLPRPKIEELEPSFYGFSDADLNQTFSVGSLKGLPETAKLGDILETLKQTYCGSWCRVHVHVRLQREALVAGVWKPFVRALPILPTRKSACSSV